MTVILRDYQQRCIDEARAYLARCRSVLIQAPTGAGKTALTSVMAGNAAKKGKRVWFIVHRRELVKQSMTAFQRAGVGYGVVSRGFPLRLLEPVQIASIQTLARRIEKLPAPDLIIYDECHHIAAGGWAAVYERYPKARHIGLSATPERLDGEGLDKFFDAIVYGPEPRELIEQGYLSDYSYFTPSAPDTSGLKTRGKDYDKNAAESAMNVPTVTGDAVAHYRRHCAGKRAVIFAVSRKHSKDVVASFNAAGIPAAHVDGDTKQGERDRALERFASGEIPVLSNVDLFGEGFDLPMIEAVILLRPTQSLGLYLQMCGRGLRTAPGKRNCVILDHAGNVARHGLPCDAREWKLAGRKKKRGGGGKQGEPRTEKACIKCSAAHPVTAERCKICGTPFPASDGREFEQVDGELTEIDKEAHKRERKREEAQARSLEDFQAIGEARGYKPGWARKRWEIRQQRRQAGAA